MKRKIIEIDEEKCTGCGLCIPSCAEGALQIIDGKARLVSDTFCDGLGACLGECPEDALRILEREAGEFDEMAVEANLREKEKEKEKRGHSHAEKNVLACGCPSTVARSWQEEDSGNQTKAGARASSQLRQWPVQLTLVNPAADYFKNAELVVAADCVPFAQPNFHQDYLKGKALVVGCPKLDDYELYLEKLTEIFKRNSLRKIIVVNMEVPCCFGLVNLVEQALAQCGKDIPAEQIVVGVRGDELLRKKILSAASSETRVPSPTR